MPGKLPAFLFYPGDWLKDPGIQSLDYFHRGAWFHILCVMHECEPRGKLAVNGKAMTKEQLAMVLGLDKQKTGDVLDLLVSSGVASLEEGTGILYCRRMVRDEYIRKVRSAAGKLGGNPLLKQKPTTPLAPMYKQKPTPSSSSSASTKKENTTYSLPASPDAPKTQKPRKKVSEGPGTPQASAPRDVSPASSDPSPPAARVAPRAGKPRPRDLIFERVCELWFPSGVSPTDRTRIGKVVRDLKAHHATPDEIDARLARYRRDEPTWTDSPEALAKHWDRFEKDKAVKPGIDTTWCEEKTG